MKSKGRSTSTLVGVVIWRLSEIVLFLFFLILYGITGGTGPQKMPIIRISCDGEEIAYISAYNRWDGIEYDREPLTGIVYADISEVPVIKIGSNIDLKVVNARPPNEAFIQQGELNFDHYKHELEIVDITRNEEKLATLKDYSFPVTLFDVEGFDKSNPSYNIEDSIYYYRITFMWRDGAGEPNNCEYYFAIRVQPE